MMTLTTKINAAALTAAMLAVIKGSERDGPRQRLSGLWPLSQYFL